MKEIDKKTKKGEEKLLVGTQKINGRGRIFKGIVIKKFSNRVVIQFERMVYIRKYERYTKSLTKLHARLPSSMEDQINV